ncbi:diguanylate cyclase domain-containing protein [Nocardia suismassiliense]|uniref:Diguanylate cyclase domain-containing protein n=1 Tax=Nocardia suismassiliense TaxID=2077092 RepID=A0ABW6R5D2_9NOCA
MTNNRLSFRSRWQYRVDYHWVVDFLEYHSVLGRIKVVIGAGGLMMLVNAMLMAVSPAGVHGRAGTAVTMLSAVIGGSWAVRWWALPWPRESESLAWIAVIDVVTTVDSMLVQDRVLGALGVLMLVATGTYVAVFHSPRILALSLGWSLLSILVLSATMVLGTGRWRGDIALGIAVVVADLAVIGVVLPTVQLSHWLLRMDALSDPLTRLLNRRGLDSHWSERAGWAGRPTGYAIALDLDRFKTVNDTFGHPFGDEVLQRTADRLRSAADSDALIARTGGEEFAVVGWVRDVPAAVVAERLRAAIATMPGLPITITASVGAALFTASRTGELPPHQHVLRAADAAMYRAKRLGGNTVVVTEVSRSAQEAAPEPDPSCFAQAGAEVSRLTRPRHEQHRRS